MTDVLYVTTNQYREATGLAERTLKRYLAQGKIPGALKDDDGRWRIPADAEPPVVGETPPAQASEAQALILAQRAARRELEAQPTLADVIAREPAFVPLETAARLLGITAHAIRSNPQAFETQRWGERGSLVVPLRIIRQAAGL